MKELLNPSRLSLGKHSLALVNFGEACLFNDSALRERFAGDSTNDFLVNGSAGLLADERLSSRFDSVNPAKRALLMLSFGGHLFLFDAKENKFG